MGAGTNGFGPMFTNSSDGHRRRSQRDQLSRVALSAGTATTDELDQAITDLEDEQRRARPKHARRRPAKAEQVERGQAGHRRAEGRVRSRPAPRPRPSSAGCIQEEEERRARESYAADAAARPSRPPPGRPRRPQQAQARRAAPLAAGRRWRRWRRRRRRGRGRARRGRLRPRRPDPRGVVAGRHGHQRGAEPARRRRTATPPPSPAWRSTAPASRRGRGRRPACRCRTSRGPSRRSVPNMPGRRGAARRPAVLLLADQPRQHLPRRRPARARPQQRHDRHRRLGQLGQRRRRRPPGLTRLGPTARPLPLTRRARRDSISIAVGPWLEDQRRRRRRPVRRDAHRWRPLQPDVHRRPAPTARGSSLRRPPLGHVLATAHDMAREHRIIAAVGPTAVPVPPALGLCTDTEVNGAPFYVMGYVDGVVLDSPDKAAPLDPAPRQGERRPDRRARRPPRRRRRRRRPRRPRPPRGLHRAPAEALDDAVGELQDPRAAGDRRGRRAARPRGSRRSRASSIAHGDYRFGNCLIDPERRAHRRRPRLGAVHARRPARRRRLPRRVLDRPGRQRRPPQRPVGRRGLPDLRRAARALRRRAPVATSRHRLLRRVLVVAAGRDQRGRLRPLPARGDGRPGHRPGRAGRRSRTAPSSSPTQPSTPSAA